ncbi:hypothetical protein BDN72DRAFT_84938 [Pluteus cervinus]|uniref:Uncharacterized protein n=1 Tax=Pluteus cervinus TaxID=181527 RepID=A0ACD3AQW1_9AGAR|nr:hypothetical protein BDN72DRAFT_84938 [Pluteus cervinus]
MTSLATRTIINQHSLCAIQNSDPTNSVSSTEQKVVDQVLEALRQRTCFGGLFDSAERGEPPRCHPETRHAVISSTSSWLEGLAIQKYVRWILGWAGVGKSALAQSIAELFFKRGQLAASFFFSRATPDRDHIHTFVPTIAYQLATSVPGAREIIVQQMVRDATIFEKSFDGQWKALVVETLRKVPPPSVPMLIIIDGIDECESLDEQRTLLESIIGCADRLGPSFKLLIASRPERQIQRVFDQFPSIDKVELGNSEQCDADIGLFLRQSLGDIRRVYEHRGAPITAAGSSWPIDDTIQKLVAKASGQFIYASVVVQFVKSHQGDPKVPLDLVLQSWSKSFEALDNLYLIVMENIQKSIPKKRRPLLHHLMVCILMDLVSSYNSDLSSFCPKELDKPLIKVLLGSLHPVVDSNGRFRHITFCNFLTRPSNPHPFSITSRHVSRITYRALRSLLEEPRSPWVKAKSLFCLLHSSPTPKLIFRLAFLPQKVFEGSQPILENDQVLWHPTWLSRLLLGWLRVRVSNYDLPVFLEQISSPKHPTAQ